MFDAVQQETNNTANNWEQTQGQMTPHSTGLMEGYRNSVLVLGRKQ